MRNWFNNLEEKTKKVIVWGTWIGCIVSLIIVGSIPESSWDKTIIDDLLVFVFLGLVTFAVLFSIWKVKYKKDSASTTKESENTIRPQVVVKPVVNESKPITFEVNKDIKFNYPINKTFFYIDVETADLHNDTICAIGAVIIKNGEEKRFYSLINPKVHITNTNIHGISDDDVEYSPTLDEYWETIVKELGDDYIIIGHNIAFDISVLEKDLKRYNINFSVNKKIDTMAIAKDIYYNHCTQSGDLKLDTICDRLNIDLDHHNAESDIYATKEVLETLLSSANRKIDDFINVHYSSARTITINNVSNVRINKYWDDIEIGRTPVYFTNWTKIDIDFVPEYDKVNIEDLICASMMNRETCGIARIVKQTKLIKEFILGIGGKCLGKGSKTAKSYIEYYYMDVEEYSKLKTQGYKIFHAIDVEDFITNNQEEIKKYIESKEQEKLEKIRQEEQLKREKEEKKQQRKLEEEQKKLNKEPTKRLVQMNDDGIVIKIYDKLADAIRETGVNSKSIRDCCNGKQKHAGGFVWKYIQEDKE